MKRRLRENTNFVFDHLAELPTHFMKDGEKDQDVDHSLL
jgi:hypothetical protein